MTLVALYLGCLTLGGIFIGASMLGGGSHADNDAGMDHGEAGHGADHGDADHAGADHGSADHGVLHDHGHDTKADLARFGSDTAGIIGATLLSIRFWTFALASFGLTGLLLQLFGIVPLLGLPIALVTAFFVGATVTATLRKLAHGTVSTATGTRQLAGREADVVLRVGPGKVGKVRLQHQGQILELPATTQEDRVLERGERVLLVEVTDGRADVTPLLPRPHPPPTTEGVP